MDKNTLVLSGMANGLTHPFVAELRVDTTGAGNDNAQVFKVTPRTNDPLQSTQDLIDNNLITASVYSDGTVTVSSNDLVWSHKASQATLTYSTKPALVTTYSTTAISFATNGSDNGAGYSTGTVTYSIIANPTGQTAGQGSFTHNTVNNTATLTVTRAGVFTVLAMKQGDTTYRSAITEPYTFTVRPQLVAKPVVRRDNVTYTGNPVNMASADYFYNYNTTYLTVSGQNNASAAGVDYSVTVGFTAAALYNYRWLEDAREYAAALGVSDTESMTAAQLLDVTSGVTAKQWLNMPQSSALPFTYSISKGQQSAPLLINSGVTDASVTLGEVSFYRLVTTGGNGTGAVTYYVISGNDYAELDGSTGVLFPKKAGTIVIQAVKAADANYEETTATFTLAIAPATVIPDPDPAPKSMTGTETTLLIVGMTVFLAADILLIYFFLIRPKKLKYQRAAALLNNADRD
jgi:hypothetical protein